MNNPEATVDLISKADPEIELSYSETSKHSPFTNAKIIFYDYSFC